jgi:MoxR-like ATPase
MTFSPQDIAFLRGVRAEVGRTMFGLDGVVNALLVALVSGGHVLLEGNPGLGKTALVKAMARALGLSPASVGRIQFTPDLMPSDITGTRVPAEDGSMRLVFERGPLFCRLLIADEINRATPKTQAALLEAMAERQVTVLGRTERLDAPVELRIDGLVERVRPPFLVMATQNPIDQEGTYELPEAQSDRFMFKVRMPFPGRSTLAAILAKETGPDMPRAAAAPPPADEGAALWAIHRAAVALRETPAPPAVEAHVMNVILATNGAFGELEAVPDAARRALEGYLDRIAWPLGPRAATALLLGARGWAAAALVAPDAAREAGSRARAGLAAVALPVLRHRLRLDEGFGAGGAEARADRADAAIREIVGLCAPTTGGYDRAFAADAAVAAEGPRL